MKTSRTILLTALLAFCAAPWAAEDTGAALDGIQQSLTRIEGKVDANARATDANRQAIAANRQAIEDLRHAMEDGRKATEALQELVQHSITLLVGGIFAMLMTIGGGVVYLVRREAAPSASKASLEALVEQKVREALHAANPAYVREEPAPYR